MPSAAPPRRSATYRRRAMPAYQTAGPCLPPIRARRRLASHRRRHDPCAVARRPRRSSLTAPDASNLTDRSHRVFHALGVLIPKLGKLRLILIGEHVADVVDRLGELLGGRGFLGLLAQPADDRIGRTLGSKQADPQGEFDVQAELFQGWYLGQRLGAFCRE